MIDRCVGIMSARGIMPETEARVLLTDVMPLMKRGRARRSVQRPCDDREGVSLQDPEENLGGASGLLEDQPPVIEQLPLETYAVRAHS
jgi:hypothetical protein